MEIRRFGIGYRRHEGPAGTHGVDGQSIHADRRGVIAELAFRPNAAMAPHTNPNRTYFVIIEGGGFVQVGDERARVAAGEAVVWPPNVVHAAWTEQSSMRALVVEFAVGGADSLLLEGGAVEMTAQADESSERGSGVDASSAPEGKTDGGLVFGRGGRPDDRESPDGEPW